MRKLCVGLVSIALVQMWTAPFTYAVGSGGFEVAINGARALSKSNAVTADPEDPSTIAFNPAGLTELGGNQVTMGVGGVLPFYEYDGINGTNEDSSVTLSPVPSFFTSFSTPIESLKVGSGVNSPFGLQTKYDSDGSFKYSTYFNELITIDYHLSAALKIAPWLSIGGGWEYVEADLKQVGKLNSNFITSTVIPGTTGLADAPFELDVDGHGYGYNLGALFQLSDTQRLGIFYHSQIRLKLTGEISVDTLQGLVLPAIFGGSSFNTGADTDITLPSSVTVGYNIQLNEKWGWSLDFAWTDWSTFDQVDVLLGTTNVVLNGLEPVNEDFNDTVSVYTAASYKFNDTWTGSFGYFFLEMAANEDNYSNVIPDGDRHAVTLGIQFNQKKYSIDAAYLLEFIDEVSIENNVGLTNGTSIDGNYSGLVHVFTLGATYRY